MRYSERLRYLPCGLVVAQVNPQMPYTYGDAVRPVDEIDLALEADVPLPSPAPRTGHGADLHKSVGARVAGLVPLRPHSRSGSAACRTPSSPLFSATTVCRYGRKCSATEC